MNFSGSGLGARPFERVSVIRLSDTTMQFIEQRDGNNVIVRSGILQSTGRVMPDYVNCGHPKMVEQRLKLESEERERIRRAQAIAEEQRQRMEREEAARHRRQQERDRLYKL